MVLDMMTSLIVLTPVYQKINLKKIFNCKSWKTMVI